MVQRENVKNCTNLLVASIFIVLTGFQLQLFDLLLMKEEHLKPLKTMGNTVIVHSVYV